MEATKANKQSQKQRSSPQEGRYVANVPVKIAIGQGETIIQEYLDEIEVDFTNTIPEGRKHIALFVFLRTEKGLSTEEAIFTIASEAVKEEAERIAAKPLVSAPRTLRVHVKRNGAITYGKYSEPRL